MEINNLNTNQSLDPKNQRTSTEDVQFKASREDAITERPADQVVISIKAEQAPEDFDTTRNDESSESYNIMREKQQLEAQAERGRQIKKTNSSVFRLPDGNEYVREADKDTEEVVYTPTSKAPHSAKEAEDKDNAAIALPRETVPDNRKRVNDGNNGGNLIDNLVI